MSRWFYTDEQIQYIKELRDKENLSWEDVLFKFIERYPEYPRNNSDALRSRYKAYSGVTEFTTDSTEVIDLVRRDSFVNRKATRLARTNRTLNNIVADLEDMKQVFEEFIKNSKFTYHRPLPKQKSKTKQNRTILAHISDTHFGAIVDKDELGQTNEYNYKIACRRIAHYCKNLASYKLSKRKETELVLVLNGDILAGIIHSREWGVELMAKQFVIALSILTQAISYLAQNFSKVTVYTTTGNHDRMIHKGSSDRATIHKWDSYATMVFFSLKEKFADYKNVEINTTKTPYVSFHAQGHKVFATHCDTVVNLGNTSKTLPMDSIANQINKINNSDIIQGEKFRIFMFAHVHSILATITNNGEHVFINGSVLGSDSFSQSIGVFSNNPCQQFVELTKEHIGDMRFVTLKEADTCEELDKIIKPNPNI